MSTHSNGIVDALLGVKTMQEDFLSIDMFFVGPGRLQEHLDSLKLLSKDGDVLAEAVLRDVALAREAIRQTSHSAGMLAESIYGKKL